MTDFWTDKKRGFVGVPGNLGPNTQSLSVQRFMRQELGGLDQTQAKRFTPDGEMTIKAFGNYEKVISEPIKKEEEIKTSNERLVIFNNYNWPDERQFARLIQIKPGSYEEIWSVDLTTVLPVGSAVYNVSWNYRTNKFIVFLYDSSNYFYSFYEVRVYMDSGVQRAEATLITSVDPYGDDWFEHETGTHNYPLFFHSYGATGEQDLMWLGFDEYYKGYYYILPLNKKYGFVKKGAFSAWAQGASNYDKDVDHFPNPLPGMCYEIALIDCDSYHHETWNVPTLSWVTFNNVRIQKPVTDALENWYGQANQRACEVRNKIAVVFDKDIQEGKAPYAIHLCESLPAEKSVDANEHKYMPGSYMDESVTIKESEIFATGATTLQWSAAAAIPVHIEGYGWTETLPYVYTSLIPNQYWITGYSPAYALGPEEIVYVNGIRYLKLTVIEDGYVEFPSYALGPPWNYVPDVTLDIIFSGNPPYHSFHYLKAHHYERLFYIWYPPWMTDHVVHFEYPGYTNVDLGDRDIEIGGYTWHLPAAPDGSMYVAIINVAIKEDIPAWVQRETYSDMRYVNNHYAVVGDEYTTWNYRLFVANNDGDEKYEIPLTDPDDINSIKIERVIVQ